MNRQVAKISQQISHRIQQSTEDTFATQEQIKPKQKPNTITIKAPIYAELKRKADSLDTSVERYINQILSRHLKNTES